MLGGRAWAEASRELLPSNARAETWGCGRLREVVQPAGALGQAVPTPGLGGTHLLCVTKEEALLPGVNVQDNNDRVAGVHDSSPIFGPQGLCMGARG